MASAIAWPTAVIALETFPASVDIEEAQHQISLVQDGPFVGNPLLFSTSTLGLSEVLVALGHSSTELLSSICYDLFSVMTGSKRT